MVAVPIWAQPRPRRPGRGGALIAVILISSYYLSPNGRREWRGKATLTPGAGVGVWIANAILSQWARTLLPADGAITRRKRCSGPRSFIFNPRRLLRRGRVHKLAPEPPRAKRG